MKHGMVILLAGFIGASFDASTEQTELDTQATKKYYQTVLEQKAAEGNAANLEAAKAARRFSALSIFDKPWEALYAAQVAVKLDPDNAESWKQLAIAWTRLGNTKEAAVAHEKADSIQKKEEK